MDWKILPIITIAMILIPVVITGTTSLLGAKAKKMLVEQLGIHGQLYLGWLGTVLHEAGHAIMALIFGHHIVGIKLCRFRHLDTADTLGYVDHEYNKYSFYQNLGNFFIGIAPFFSCTGGLYIIHYLLFGTLHDFRTGIDTNSAWQTAHMVLLNSISNLEANWGSDIQQPVRAAVFLVIVLIVSMTGYAISEEDWRNTLHGSLQYFWAVLGLAVIVLIGNMIDSQVQFWAWDLIAVLAFLTLDSWLYVLISIVFVLGIKYIFFHGHTKYVVPSWCPYFKRSIREFFHKHL